MTSANIPSVTLHRSSGARKICVPSFPPLTMIWSNSFADSWITVLYCFFMPMAVHPPIYWLSVAEFVICTVLHFTGVMDYHETLTFSHVLLAISACLLLYTIIKNAFRTGKSKIRNVYRALRTFGLMGLCFATGIDIIRYYRGSTSDNAMFVRIGLLIFILCYGSSSLEKMINAVKLGVQSEFVSQLAYRDGLTELADRQGNHKADHH